MAIMPHVQALANVLKQAYVDPAVHSGEFIADQAANAGRAVYNQASTGQDVNSLGKTLYQAYLEQPVRGGKALTNVMNRGPLGTSLVDIMGMLKGVASGTMRPFNQANEYQRTYDRLRSSGIAGQTNFGLPQGTDADHLAHLLTYGGYNEHPQAQAQFVAMLKQLGYLPHQAF